MSQSRPSIPRVLSNDVNNKNAAINDVLERIKGIQSQPTPTPHDKNKQHDSHDDSQHEIRDPHGILELLRFMDGGWTWNQSRL